MSTALQTRPSSSDTESTRLLKEVLTSSAHHASNPPAGGRRLSTGGTKLGRRLFIDQLRDFPAGSGPPATPPKDGGARQRRRTATSLPRPESASGSGVLAPLEATAGLGGTADLLPLLSDSDRRIRSLHARLKAWEGDLMSPARATACRQADQGSGVCILPWSGGDEKAAMSRSWRAEVDRVAAKVVTQCAVFPRLDELEGITMQSANFEQLREAQMQSGRKAFPRHYLHHPGVVLLTDRAMEDADEFHRATRTRAASPAGEQGARITVTAADRQGPGARSRSVPALQ